MRGTPNKEHKLFDQDVRAWLKQEEMESLTRKNIPQEYKPREGNDQQMGREGTPQLERSLGNRSTPDKRDPRARDGRMMIGPQKGDQRRVNESPLKANEDPRKGKHDPRRVNEDPRRLNEIARKPYEDPRRIKEDSRKLSVDPMKMKDQQGQPNPSLLNNEQTKNIGKLIQDASKVLKEDPRLMKHDQRRLSGEHVNKHEHRKLIEKQRSYDPDRDRHSVKGNEDSRKSDQPFEVSKKVHDSSRKTIVDPRKINESPRKVTEEQRKTVENRKSTNEDQTKFIGKLIEDASRLLKEDPFCLLYTSPSPRDS